MGMFTFGDQPELGLQGVYKPICNVLSALRHSNLHLKSVYFQTL